MQAWIAAVMGQINSAGLATVMGNQPSVNLDAAPESAVMPLIVIEAKASSVRHDLALNRYMDVQADITVYGELLSAAVAGAQAIAAAIDGVNFAVAGMTLLASRVIESPAASLVTINSAGVPVYQVRQRVSGKLFAAR
jgi:hypothetical protein